MKIYKCFRTRIIKILHAKNYEYWFSIVHVIKVADIFLDPCVYFSFFSFSSFFNTLWVFF